MTTWAPMGVAVGQQVQSAAGSPVLAGLVERAGEAAYPEELLLRLDAPAPGIAHLFAMPMGGQIYLPVRLYLYGDGAPDAVSREQPIWQTWMTEHFPVAAASTVG